MDGRRERGAPAFRVSGWGGPECFFTDAKGRKGEMGGPIEWYFRILQFSGETSCGLAGGDYNSQCLTLEVLIKYVRDKTV